MEKDYCLCIVGLRSLQARRRVTSTLPCHLLFDAVATDYSMCCAFNLDKADDLYRDSDFLASTSRLRQDDKENASS